MDPPPTPVAHPQVTMEDAPRTPATPSGPIDVGLSSLGLPFDPNGTADELAAEVQVEHGQVQVTVSLPAVAPDDVRYFVGSNLLLVWSHSDPENVRTMVRLPVDVVQDTSVVRFNNGVFDLTVLAAESDRPNPNPQSREGSA